MMIRVLSFITVLLLASPALAVTATVSGPDVLAKDVAGAYEITLSDAAGKQILPDALKDVHQSRMHLLVVDASMTDYQHIHPRPTSEGRFAFSFAPKTAHSYVAWVDVTLADGRHHYLPLDLKGMADCAAPCIDLTPVAAGASDGVQATLTFDNPVRAGGMAMGMLKLLDADGKPVADLEPVMGAFAHVVGFYAGKKQVVHLHPMGREPADDQARGGPDLMFHLEPDAAGVIKLFAQVKRGGRDIFIPFTVVVEQGA